MLPKLGTAAIAIAALCVPVQALEKKHGVVVGAVIDVSAATKTVTVKAADGTEHALVFAGHTTVHGAKDVGKGGQDAFKGLKAVKVTGVHVGRGAKTVAVKTEDGAEETYRVTGRAAEEISKEVAKGGKDAAKGTAYVTEEAGHKVVHFFQWAI